MSLSAFRPNESLNRGVRPSSLTGEALSQAGMFARSHFPIPTPLPQGFQVVIPGRPDRYVTPQMLETFDTIERGIVLECAGNGRALMDPVPDGVPWKLGGVSPISVRGVRLADLLGSLPDEIVDVVFTGADQGLVEPEGNVSYAFSIDRELATSNAPVLATHIGHAPLTPEHGAPVRLIVPGHYGMKSVKWLTRIEGMTSPFDGHFVNEYRYREDTEMEGEAPVGEIAVRSVISSPVDDDTTGAGPVDIRGSAWTGSGEVVEVVISVDDGDTWHAADLIRRETAGRWGAIRWSAVVDLEPGTTEIIARATDADGATQPLEPRWNAHGYANNTVHRITVHVIEP